MQRQRAFGEAYRRHRPQTRSFFCAKLATLLLLTIAMPSLPATAAKGNDFQTCATNVAGAGISPEEAASACAGALHPKELSDCVVNINKVAPGVVPDAVVACYQARRPVDLGTCVSDISKGIPDAVAANVLDYCRRTLLPTRFSDCVVGVKRASNFPALQAMETCIEARDVPQNIIPTGVPQQQVPFQVTPTPAPSNRPANRGSR